MNPTSECPDDSELLALAAGDAATPEVRSHIDACSPCRRALLRLKDEVDHLRSSIELDVPPARDAPLRPHPAGG